jgi:hypothetical protein
LNLCLSTEHWRFHFSTFFKRLLHVWPWARHWPLLLNGPFKATECLMGFLKGTTVPAPRRALVFFRVGKAAWSMLTHLYNKHTFSLSLSVNNASICSLVPPIWLPEQE